MELPEGIVSQDGVNTVTLTFDTSDMSSTTLNVACAGHFAHQQARNDFRYLRYMLPCAALACLALTLCPVHTLPAILHLLFACALLQALCVAVDLWRSHGRA